MLVDCADSMQCLHDNAQADPKVHLLECCLRCARSATMDYGTSYGTSIVRNVRRTWGRIYKEEEQDTATPSLTPRPLKIG